MSLCPHHLFILTPASQLPTSRCTDLLPDCRTGSLAALSEQLGLTLLPKLCPELRRQPLASGAGMPSRPADCLQGRHTQQSGPSCSAPHCSATCMV